MTGTDGESAPGVDGDGRVDAAKATGEHELRPVSASAKVLLVACLALLTGWLAQTQLGLAAAPARMLFILVLAAGLWLTEAIPAYAVGILVIALQILLLGNPEGGIFADEPDDWQTFVVVLGNPLIWLFFGGFVLSAAIARTELDQALAGRLVGWFGGSPSALLFGVMAGSLLFSMFMSNTATTAMMLAIVTPLVAILGRSAYARGLLLGVPFAANLGGMATIIGSPPNAIAAGSLAYVPGQAVDFLGWMTFGLPPALLLFTLTWLYLRFRYPDREDGFQRIRSALALQAESKARAVSKVPLWQRRVAVGTLLATVALWMTGEWTGLPTAVVSFLPITLFTATGILADKDVRGLPWDILLLLAGGLALGNGVRDTGLADWLVAQLPLAGLGELGVVLLLCYATLVLSNLMSNTAAANILVPIAVVMGSGFESLAVIPLALCASCAMCLPISTPPNAIAFSSGHLAAGDFMRGGLLIGALAPLVAVGWVAALSG